jgi:hypothetical protein
MLSLPQHQLSRDLLALVYMDPRRYDRSAIRSMLGDIQRDHPEHAQAIMQPAFERVVENSGEDNGTGMIDLFLIFGGTVNCPGLFQKATQILEPAVHSPAIPQVHAVLFRLIQAGADPQVSWPELGGRTAIDELADLSNPACLRAVERVLGEVMADQQLETNTAPALAPSR